MSGQRRINTLQSVSLLSAAVFVLFTNASTLFAQTTSPTHDNPGQLRRISEGFAGRHDELTTRDLMTLVWGALLLAIVIALTFIAYTWQKSDAERFGGEYRKLARDLDLSLVQLWVLDRIARRCGLRNAMGLLISRGTFDHWTTLYFEQANDSRRERLMRNQVQLIRVRLFAEA